MAPGNRGPRRLSSKGHDIGGVLLSLASTQPKESSDGAADAFRISRLTQDSKFVLANELPDLSAFASNHRHTCFDRLREGTTRSMEVAVGKQYRISGPMVEHDIVVRYVARSEVDSRSS